METDKGDASWDRRVAVREKGAVERAEAVL